MNTQLDVDPQLLELVRRADPMRDPRVRAEAAWETEAALRRLVSELDHSPGRGRRRRRPRPALRVAAVAAVTAAAAFVVTNVVSSGHGSAVSSAQAKAMIRHAGDALLYPSGGIVEEDVVTTVTAPVGSTSTSEAHQWVSTSAPYDNRLTMIENGNVLWEQSAVNGRLDLYDPARTTLYVAPASSEKLVPDDPNVTSGLAEVKYLLKQPNVTVDPKATLDGAPAIEFTDVTGRFSYWASPGDYQPLQSVDRHDPLGDGRTGVAISRYPIERVLTGQSASPSLLSLQAQHPNATVDTSAADYQAARQRLLRPGS